MFLDSFYQARQASKTAWKKKGTASFEIRKTIVALKCLTSWTVNKLTAAQTKMKVGKSRTAVGQ